VALSAFCVDNKIDYHLHFDSQGVYRVTLADLKRGESAKIVAIDSKENSVQRLMIMGLVEGAEVQCLGRSLGGDPMELLIHGSALSLRQMDAQYFSVAHKAENDKD
jgi:ferrous iron transport protein A|tara:strand:+ start:195 stop:512 length:318 start_codon:yes stop_codon:yes gene_type:complete